MRKHLNWKKPNWKFPKVHIPKLSIGKRLWLYGLMILAAVLALYNVVTETLPYEVGIASYVLAACTVFPGSYYFIMDMLKLGKIWKIYLNSKIEANAVTSKIKNDPYLKTVLFALPATFISVLYALYNGYLGIRYSSPWLGTMAAYYYILAIMRLGAIRQNRIILQQQRISNNQQAHQNQRIYENQNDSNEIDEKLRMKKEDAIYRRNSMLFIGLAVVLAGAVILLLHSIGGETYGEYTIFIAALFAFYKLIHAFIVMAKDRKSSSPLITILKKVAYADSLVSILMLQTALLNAFGEGNTHMILTFNLFTGIGVCIMILIAGIQGIIVSNRRRKTWKMEEQHDSYISGGR